MQCKAKSCCRVTGEVDGLLTALLSLQHLSLLQHLPEQLQLTRKNTIVFRRLSASSASISSVEGNCRRKDTNNPHKL